MKQLTDQYKVLLLGASAALLGVLTVVLFFEERIGINFLLFVLLILSVGLFLAAIYGKRIDGEQNALALVAIVFAAMVFFRSSDLLTFFNIVTTIALLLITLRMLTGRQLRTFLVSDYVKAAFQPFLFIAPFFETIAFLIATRGNFGPSGRRKEIIRGSIMAVIAVVIFGALFASADAQFSELFSDIFNFHFGDKNIPRLIFGTFMTAFFVGAFGYLFRKTHSHSAPQALLPRNLGAIEMTILLQAVNAIFFIFVIVQVAAIFGGVEHLFANGLTYAEYAREGFLQLIVVAILSFLMILFTESQIIQRDGEHLRSFRVLSGVLVFQVILILISAFHRLTMYEDAYGFTTARFFSHMLMVWLSIALVILSFHVWQNGKRQVLLFRLFSSAIVLFLLTNIMNPDAFIAKKNIERYAATGRIDASYLGTLSDDALPYTIQLINHPDENIRNAYARQLYWQHRRDCDTDCGEWKERSWKSTRVTDAQSERLLAPYRQLLEKYKTWTPPISD